MANKYKTTSKGRVAPNGYRLCDPLKEGEILVDIRKKQWVIGKTIGCGGFGEIYLTYEKTDPANVYVMKLDNLSGPIFVEVHFMLRAGQSKSIQSFMEKNHLDFLGIPRFITHGVDNLKNGGYRFIVMERLGEELQNVLEKTRLSINVSCRIACRIIDSLEYIHDQGYIHADIKAQNILRATVSADDQSRTRKSKKSAFDDDDKYVLIDYGLAERYTYLGAHKPNEHDKRTANNGTCEFRSRDAHVGVISRRSDIESLGYNIILWFYGRHPWGNMLKNADHVQEKKNWAMNNIDIFLKEAFSEKPLDSDESSSTKATTSKSKVEEKKKNIPVNTTTPKGLNKFFEEIKNMEHDARPNYSKLKDILTDIGRMNADSPGSINGAAKKKSTTNGVQTVAKKPAAKGLKRNSDIYDEEENIVDISTSSTAKKAKAAKTPAKRSNVKSAPKMNGTRDDDTDETEVEEDENEEEEFKPYKRAASKANNKTPVVSSKKTNRLASSKRKGLNGSTVALNGKANGKSVTQTRKPTSKNRINVKEELLNDDFSLMNSASTKRTPLPRLSTPLVMITTPPQELGKSPLFGPFEPDDSVKENRDLHSNRSNNVSFVQNSDDDDAQDRDMKSCRVYIGNKRHRLKKQQSTIENGHKGDPEERSTRSASRRSDTSLNTSPASTVPKATDAKPGQSTLVLNAHQLKLRAKIEAKKKALMESKSTKSRNGRVKK